MPADPWLLEVALMKEAGIVGLGAFMPEEIRTNDWWIENGLLQHVPERHQADPFQKIVERRVTDPSMEPSDIEVLAGASALAHSGLKKEQIDLVMVHSFVPDRHVPLNASLVQHKLGLQSAAAWNVDTCCSSFITMLIMASSLIRSGMFRHILIITSVVHSRILDYTEHISVVPGDGAAAVVVAPVDEPYGYKGFHCTSDGSLHDAITIEVRPPRYRERKHYEPSLEQPFATFNNPEAISRIGHESLHEMTLVMDGALQNAGMARSDLNFIVTHQPSYWAAKAWAEAVGLMEESQRHDSYPKYGNLASVSVPVNLEEAFRLGKLRKGMNVMMASSGVGINHAACIMRWAI